MSVKFMNVSTVFWFILRWMGLTRMGTEKQMLSTLVFKSTTVWFLEFLFEPQSL